MGLNLSKRVEKSLSTSGEFHAGCEAAYSESLSESQHAFPGIPHYQILPASLRLHHYALQLHVINRWAPSPPTQIQVDSALRLRHRQLSILDLPEFERFAVDLYRQMIVEGVSKAVFLRGLPAGAVGIAGLTLLRGAGPIVVGRAVGVYAVAGVAVAAFCLGLS